MSVYMDRSTKKERKMNMLSPSDVTALNAVFDTCQCGSCNVVAVTYCKFSEFSTWCYLADYAIKIILGY